MKLWTTKDDDLLKRGISMNNPIALVRNDNFLSNMALTLGRTKSAIRNRLYMYSKHYRIHSSLPNEVEILDLVADQNNKHINKPARKPVRKVAPIKTATVTTGTKKLTILYGDIKIEINKISVRKFSDLLHMLI